MGSLGIRYRGHFYRGTDGDISNEARQLPGMALTSFGSVDTVTPIKEPSMMPRWIGVLCVWTLSIVPATLFAQGGRGTILGAVSDETGAAVPRVSITILNTGTQ